MRSNTKLRHTASQSSLKSTLPAHVETGLKRTYRDAVRSVDRFVGVLWRELASDDPLLVFHSDHGEAFNEHGSYGHQPELYEENIHTPLLLHDPNAEVAARIDEPITLRTLPNMLLSRVDGDEELTSRHWCSEYIASDTIVGDKAAIRTERWKYISAEDSEELYDLKQDPNERNNLIDRHPVEADELREALHAYVQGLPEMIDRSTSRQKELPSDIEESLKALGYNE